MGIFSNAIRDYLWFLVPGPPGGDRRSLDTRREGEGDRRRDRLGAYQWRNVRKEFRHRLVSDRRDTGRRKRK